MENRALFLSPDLKIRKERILRSLSKKRYVKKFCYLVLPDNGNGLLNLYSGKTLRREIHAKERGEIIGVTDSKENGKLLAAEILSLVYRESGSFDISAYLRKFGEG